MAAATVYSSRYNSNNHPIGGRPLGGIGRPQVDWVTHTVPTTSTDDVGDRTNLFAVPEGAVIYELVITAEDLDTNATETLDADIVLSTIDSAGTVTDTILYNAGTALEDALTRTVVDLDVTVPDSALGYGHIQLKVNTVAATPAEGDIFVRASWR